ncbi:MAG: class I SAM-dependent methyltransferase [Candidatus Poseidoniaceae archaeon]|nr:class I SAM-dependent methyltransferase [Candidatus Poseidoniaceae archaeon]
MTEIKDNFSHRINPVSINLPTLEFLKDYIENNEVASILEFGSGVSTEFWSEKLPQAHVISYENSRRYRKITASRVDKHADNIHVRFGPLRIMKLFGRRYISYKTGSYLRKNAPKSFDLVLIDGPPGFLYSREATLLQAINHISETTQVILDDAEREIEKATIKRWGEMFDMHDLKFHKMGKKEIATFRISPTPKLAKMPESPHHKLGKSIRLLLTFYKQNIMHNLWLFKMRLFNKEPFPDQKMSED